MDGEGNQRQGQTAMLQPYRYIQLPISSSLNKFRFMASECDGQT